MIEELVTFQVAKLAKEKGFDWGCNSYFDEVLEVCKLNYFSGNGNGFAINSKIGTTDLFGMDDAIATAPTQSLLQKWLREVHNIYCQSLVSYADKSNVNKKHHYEIAYKQKIISSKGYYPTYELALEAGLHEALKLIVNDK